MIEFRDAMNRPITRTMRASAHIGDGGAGGGFFGRVHAVDKSTADREGWAYGNGGGVGTGSGGGREVGDWWNSVRVRGGNGRAAGGGAAGFDGDDGGLACTDNIGLLNHGVASVDGCRDR